MSNKKYKHILNTLYKAGIVRLDIFAKFGETQENDGGMLVNLLILDLLNEHTKSVNYELEKLSRCFMGIDPRQTINVDVKMWGSVDSKGTLQGAEIYRVKNATDSKDIFQNIGSYEMEETVKREMNPARSIIFAKKVLKPTLETLEKFLKAEKVKKDAA